MILFEKHLSHSTQLILYGLKELVIFSIETYFPVVFFMTNIQKTDLIMLQSKQLSTLPLQSPYSRQKTDGKRNKMIFQVCVSIFENIFKNSTQAVQFLAH